MPSLQMKTVFLISLAITSCGLGLLAYRHEGQKGRDGQSSGEVEFIRGQSKSYEYEIIRNSDTLGQGHAINANGAVIGNRELADPNGVIFHTRYFFCDATTSKDMPIPAEYTNAEALALSDNNLVAGFVSRAVGHENGSVHAVVWEPSTDVIAFLPPAEGDTSCVAQSISSDGTRISGYSTGYQRLRPALWTQDPSSKKWKIEILPTMMDYNPYLLSSSLQISPDGTRLVGCCTEKILPGDIHDSSLYLWMQVDGQWQRQQLSDEQLYIRRINDRGEIVGSLRGPQGRLPVVVLPSGEVRLLSLLPGDVSGDARDINEQSAIVGWSDEPIGPTGGPKPCTWNVKGDVSQLELTAIPFAMAYGINDSGQITGMMSVPISLLFAPAGQLGDEANSADESKAELEEDDELELALPFRTLKSLLPKVTRASSSATEVDLADRPAESLSPVWPPTPEATGLCRWVDPMIGTGGMATVNLCSNNFPGAMAPWGMVRLSPDTSNLRRSKASNMSGYFYDDPYIVGFSHTRLAGAGVTDGGNFSVLPAVSAIDSQRLTQPSRYSFSHDKERAFPGYYAVWLNEPGVLAELTSTTRVGVHRYTFPANQTPHLQVRVTSVLGKGRAEEGFVKISEDRRQLEGSARTFGSFSSRYGGSKVYFVARCSQPIASHLMWSDTEVHPGKVAFEGSSIGVDLQFDSLNTPSTVELRVGISYISVENARENLEAEAGNKSFDEVLAQTSNAWEKQLSSIEIEGGTEDARKIFYTALYRCMNLPTLFNDVNGQYIGADRQVRQADGFNYYTDLSLWDTFRTTHPLYALIYPDRQRDMLVSLVEMAKQTGALPRWPSGGSETNSMFGTPADFVVAESYLKGIRDFDVQFAFEKMKAMADSPPPPASKFSGREQIEHYVKFSYCPYDFGRESVAKTLEYCYADYCIARLAEALGRPDEAALFDLRAKNYKNLWNEQTQFFQPKDSKGEFFQEFKPEMLTYVDFQNRYTTAYVEGSAWQWRWAVPHDPHGLIELFESTEKFVEQLGIFFEKSPSKVGALPNAYYWHGNQPDLFAAFLFNSAGRPELTQKWVRWILDTKYSTDSVGLDGNDDGGTLSAWFIFGSLGFFPVAGTDLYELAGPLFDRAEIKLGESAKPLTVIAVRQSPDAVYVERVLLNGELVDGTRIRHSQIATGGELRFEFRK